MSVLSSTCGGAYFHKFFFKKRRREAKRESSQSKKKKKKKKGGKEKRQNLTKKAEFWRRRRRREKRSKESNALFSLSRPHRFVFLLLLSFDPRKLSPRTRAKDPYYISSPPKREKKKYLAREREKKNNKNSHPKLEHVVLDLHQKDTNRQQPKGQQTQKNVPLGRLRDRVADQGGKGNQKTLQGEHVASRLKSTKILFFFILRPLGDDMCDGTVVFEFCFLFLSLSFRFTHNKKRNFCDDRWRAKCNKKWEPRSAERLLLLRGGWWYLMLLFFERRERRWNFFFWGLNCGKYLLV